MKSIFKMENDPIETPTRRRGRKVRSVLGEISLTDPRINIPTRSLSVDVYKPSVAVNRLIDFKAPSGKHNGKKSHTKPLHPQQNRRVSKAFIGLKTINATPSSSLKSLDSPMTEGFVNIGTIDSPIANFRPQLWKHLEESREVLNLDLFWPQKLDESEDEDGDEPDSGIFPYRALQPLGVFRNLRSLKLVGMLRSYQPLIWQACWVNPGLEDLTLEMALKPEIHPQHKWTSIEPGWRRSDSKKACTDYRGDGGSGLLHGNFGFGEYLDNESIETARSKVSAEVDNRYLSVVNLTLGGFVVDAGPFFRWFSPLRLRHIEFKYGCVDAGFALPSHMNQLVPLTWPRVGAEPCRQITVSTFAKNDVKKVTMRTSHSKRKASMALRPRVASLLKKTFQVPKRVGSLKGMMQRSERQPNSPPASRNSSITDKAQIRPKPSSVRSWSDFTFD